MSELKPEDKKLYAAIREAIKNDDFRDSFADALTPEKFQRMWKKITGKDISIEQAKAELSKP